MAEEALRSHRRRRSVASHTITNVTAKVSEIGKKQRTYNYNFGISHTRTRTIERGHDRLQDQSSVNGRFGR